MPRARGRREAGRRCAKCGCTEDTPCVFYHLPGDGSDPDELVPCFWTADDRCSACASLLEVLATPVGPQWLLAVLRLSMVGAVTLQRNHGLVLVDEDDEQGGDPHQ